MAHLQVGSHERPPCAAAGKNEVLEGLVTELLGLEHQPKGAQAKVTGGWVHGKEFGILWQLGQVLQAQGRGSAAQ